MKAIPVRVLTILIAAIGVLGFVVANLPLPFLLGPLAACLIAALAGAPMKDVGSLGVAMRTILGLAVGASITPELLARIPDMATSVALVPPFIVIIGLVGYPFFRKVCGYDPATAYYAAMPGGFQDMIVFGEAAGGNVRTLSLIHATRVLILVTLAPILLSTVWGLSLTNPPGLPAAEIPVNELALMVAAAAVGWWAAVRVNLFGAPILGPLIACAVLSLAGLIQNRPPAEAIVAAQFFIGLGVGAKYAGVTLAELRRDVLAGSVFCLLLAAISLVFAEIVFRAGLAPPVEAFLAFAPGGQAELALLAIIVGADLAFVVTHHMTRLVLVIIGAPIVRRMTRTSQPNGD